MNVKCCPLCGEGMYETTMTTICPKIIVPQQGLDDCTTRCVACEDVGGGYYCKEYKEVVTPKEDEP